MTETLGIRAPETIAPRQWHATTIAAIVAGTVAVLTATALAGSTPSNAIYSWLPAGILALASLYLVMILRWRWAVYALVAYMPFAGLPTIMTYPSGGATTLIKDVLFVIPAYLGIAIWYVRRRDRVRILFRGLPLLPLTILVFLLLLHSFNLAGGNFLVTLIGLKVWLFYVPLMVIGYHLVNRHQDLVWFGNLMLIAAAIPVLIGLVEAIVIYSGNPNAVYDRYGAAAQAVTQNFARIGGTGSEVFLARVPSTFTFGLQYFLFLAVTISVAYAMWSIHTGRRKLFYLLFLGVVLIAAFTSGARAGYALVPGYFLVALIIDRRQRHRLRQALILMSGIVASSLVLALLLGTQAGDLLGFMYGIISHYVIEGNLLQEFPAAFDATWLGLGVGMSTGPARFAFPGADEYSLVGLESFYAKTIVEIGVPGLLAVIALFISLLAAGFRSLRQLRDPHLRRWGTSLMALVIVTVVYLVKGSVIDYDPLNAYFWLFLGLLMKLPRLEGASQPHASDGL